MLSYFQFTQTSPEQRKQILARSFGTGESFNSEAFNAWYNQRVIGHEYWYQALPMIDQKQVIRLWSKRLDTRISFSASASSHRSPIYAASSSMTDNFIPEDLLKEGAELKEKSSTIPAADRKKTGKKRIS